MTTADPALTAVLEAARNHDPLDWAVTAAGKAAVTDAADRGLIDIVNQPASDGRDRRHVRLTVDGIEHLRSA